MSCPRLAIILVQAGDNLCQAGFHTETMGGRQNGDIDAKHTPHLTQRLVELP